MSFYVSKSLPLVHSSLKHGENEDVDSKTNLLEIPTIGGIIPNVDYAWVAKGPDLEVLSTVTGCKVGAWTFGGASSEQAALIVAVDRIERPHGKMPLLAVGANFSINGSMIYEKITSLHVIDPGSEISTIPGPLRTFDGIIAVGTTNGNVYLLDICLQACEEDISNIDIARVRDEFLPCQMTTVNFPDFTRIEQLKSKSLKRGEHLGFHLNAVLDRSTEHFVLKGQDGEDRLHVNKDEVTVTALHFCPQLASLLVGYNFGAFQIWNLVTLQIVYTSPVCDDHIPITNFAIQEPVDDPRAFCYVWVAYSPETLYMKGFPYAVMYSLYYSKKEHLEDYGLIYKNFRSSMIRFQMELKQTDNRKTNNKPRGGQNLRLYSIHRVLGGRDCSTMYGNDDVLALCLAVWTVWCSDKETYTYAAVFDLNQWYKEQMPRTPNWENCSNYLIHVCVTDLVNIKNIEAGPVLDVHLLKNGLSQFRGAQRLEEHFYSTSLIFDLCCLSESSVTFIHNQSLQKTLLSQVELTGPLCLMKPEELYHQIINLGLVPLFVDIPYHGAEVPVNTQRSLIMDMALEQQLLGWLCKCASEWANGSFISIGCSLDFLLNWAFQRLITLKTNCDRLCIPLFDHSDLKLDTNAIRLLNCCCRQVNNLSSLYTFILAKLVEYLPGTDLIEEQCVVVHNLSVYYEVLLWLFNMGLLPECPLTSYEYSISKETVAVPYASENLTSYFLERRIMLKRLNKSRFSCDQSLLFIDNFLEMESGGPSIQREWQNDGGSGFYPPPSLQALLRTYLVQEMTTIHKHMVLTYLFLDLAMTLNNPSYDHIIPQLIKFPTIFRVNLSMVKLTQAFWELDHGGFISALEQLLDPLILTEDFKPWHHKVALRSFLLQDQQNLALVYLQVRKPPVLDEEDILTTISLYVSNKMVDEAIYFRKQHDKQSGYEKLLNHLFNECNNYDSLSNLLNRALSPHEEEVLLKFLKTLGKDKMELIYFMMRSRYLEAFSKHDVGAKVHHNQLGLVGQGSASATDYLVRCFKTLLPKVSTKLVDICQKEKTSLWQEVARPTPMSVFVHNPSEKLYYKSTLINAALTKAKHTFSDSFLDNALKSQELVSEETPFLRTPTSFPSQKRKCVTTITPQIIDLEPDVADHPPSAKKRKRTPTVSPRKQAIISKLDTPVVKRRTSKDKSNTSIHTPRISFTPQSILKVRELVRGKELRETSVESCAEASYMGIVPPHLEDNDVSIITPEKSKNSLKLSPRKSLPRTPRPAVHFEDSTLKDLSRFASETPVLSNIRNTRNVLSSRRSLLDASSTKSQIPVDSSKTDSTTSEEFYSPDDSFADAPKDEPLFDVSNHHRLDSPKVSHNSSTVIVDNVYETEEMNARLRSSVIQERRRRDVKTPVKEVPNATVEDSEHENMKDVSTSHRQSRSTNSMEPEIQIAESPKMKSTPKPRRGIKDSSTPIRSSPRLSRTSANNTFDDAKDEPKDHGKSPATATTVETVSPRPANKIRGRKSLSRKVLEANAINRLLSSSGIDKGLPKEKPSSVEYTVSKSETVITSTSSPTSKDHSTIHYEVKYSDTYMGDKEDSQLKHDHSEEASFYQKRVSDETVSDSILTESDISLSVFEKTYEGPQVSDSILDYMKQRRNENKCSPKVRKEKESIDSNAQNNSFPRSDRSDGTLNNSQDVDNHKIKNEQPMKTFLTKRKSINRRSGSYNNDVFKQMQPSYYKTETTVREKNVKDESILQKSRISSGLSNYEDTDTSDVSLTLNKTYDGPQMPESLIKYMKDRKERQADNADHSHNSNNGVLHEKNRGTSTQGPVTDLSKTADTPVIQVTENKVKTSEVIVIDETPDDDEPMEVDEVDVYEGLSDDGENPKDKVGETPIYEDISNSYVPCGDPEMNNFEYNKDLTDSSNTQMTREYVGDGSLGNVLERNVLGEDVFDELTKSSSNSRQTDSVSSDEEAIEAHEKGFIVDSDSLSTDSSKASVVKNQSNITTQNTTAKASEVIEISSSDSSISSSNSDSVDTREVLDLAFEGNIGSEKSSCSNRTDNLDLKKDSCSEESSDDRESIHLVIKDDSNEQPDCGGKDEQVHLADEEVVYTKDTKNGVPGVEDKTAINTVKVVEFVDEPHEDKTDTDDIIMVDEIPVIMEERVMNVAGSDVLDDKVKPSSSLCEGYHNLVNEIIDEDIATLAEDCVKEKVAESPSNGQTYTVADLPDKSDHKTKIGKEEIQQSSTEEDATNNTNDKLTTKNTQVSAEESLRSEEEFHLHLSEDTDESQEKLKQTGAEEKSTVKDAEAIKSATDRTNIITEDPKSNVTDEKSEKNSSPSTITSSHVHAKEPPKNPEVPPTINDLVEKLGTDQEPYVKLRSSDILEGSLILNDSKDDSSTPSHVRSSQRRSPSRLSLPVRRSRRLSASSRNEDDPPTPLAQVSTPTRHVPDSPMLEAGPSTSTPQGGAARRRVRTRSMDCDTGGDTPTDKDKGESMSSTTKRLRAGSISQLPAIDEENKGSVVGNKSKTRSISAVDEYTVNRRLTRRQADMMQKTLNNTPKTIAEEEEISVIEEMDPMQLLDKEPFEGKPDPEEQKVYEHSPTNSIEVRSTQSRRTRRSASVASDNSLAPSDTDVVTPKKKRTSHTKNSSNLSASGVVLGVRTRSRTTSVDGESTISQKSDSSVSPINTRSHTKAGSNADAESPVKSTRSRTKSVSSVNSAKSNNSKRSIRTRKQATSAKSDLPEIPEER